MQKLTGFVIVAGHLDIEWYQALRSYRFWTVQTFEDLKEAAKRDDFGCYVLDGQVFPLEAYLDVAPQNEGEMRQLIAEGKLAIGPFYTQFDEWLPSAESIVRNCLYGRRRAEAYGGCMKAGYLPDNFGHPRQLPKILNGFGIESLLFMRGMPEIEGGHPDEFLYTGLDGSQVLASHFRETYSGAFDLFNRDIDPIQPREVPYYRDYLSFEWHSELAHHDDPQRIAASMISNVRRIHKRYPSGVIPLIAGFDHLPPQINIGDSMKVANQQQNDIDFVMGTAEEYVALARSRAEEFAVFDMELLGSRYQNILLGTLSTRSYLKRENFACEALMERYVEPLDALAANIGWPCQSRLIDEAWENLMLNSAHDSIHGSSTDEVHVEMRARNAAVRQISAGLIHGAMAYFAGKMTHWWQDSAKGVLVYAPIKSQVPQAAEVWLPVGDSAIEIRTQDGRVLPTQVLQRTAPELNGHNEPRNAAYPDGVYRRVLFADSFAAATVSSYCCVAAQSQKFEDITAGDDFIENEHLRVEMDGGLLRLHNKRTGRWYHGLNLLEEEADAGDAWDFSPPWIPGEVVRSSAAEFTCRLAECGPVRATLELRGNMSVPANLEADKRSVRRVEMPIRFTVSLWRGVARCDIKLEIENTARDHRLRLRVASGIRTGLVRSQGHFAIIDRPVSRMQEIEPWYQPVSQLLPFREWAAVQSENDGLAIAFKGVYDYEAIWNGLTSSPELAFTLLRGVQRMGRLNMMQRKGGASDAREIPEAQCLGTHCIEWSYLPYSPTETEAAPFLPAAQAFLYPPVAHAVRTKSGESLGLPPAFGWNAANIQFSAYKRCYDANGFILRVYENQGNACEVEISVGQAQSAWLADLNEQPTRQLTIANGKVRVAVGAYKIITLKMM